jgi:hypothetical protein
MIPRCYPTNTHGEILVGVVSAEGRRKWVDYIPVVMISGETPHSHDTYNNDGARGAGVFTSLAGRQEWVDYIPVVSVDEVPGKIWRSDEDGYMRLHAHREQ